jgi:PAS domain S-box-containing protein
MLHADKEILKPWCVFIIDDSPEDRSEIHRMLLSGSERRLTFVKAETAAAGIRAVLGAVPPPDCVVLDYNLPDMDAPEVLAALIGSDGMPVCPVVVVTGVARREDGRRVLRAGAQNYIGKDWTSAQALTRAIENASEGWAMARELRQGRDALRLVADRETFRRVFGDAMRGLTDEHAIQRTASDLLGAYLQANRVMSGEVVGEGHVVVGPNYVDGVHPIEGIYSLGDYGPKLLATLRSGENVVVSDMRSDGGYTESEKAAYAQMKIVANLGIPILKNGRLVAILGVHQNVPRIWTSEEIAIAMEIAERTWAAVEHARADATLMASRVQLSQIVAIMPSFSVVLKGPEHIFELANQSFYELVQHGPEILGKTYLEALPELTNQAFPDVLDKVYQTGEKFEDAAMPLFVRRGPYEVPTEIFVDFVCLPLRGVDGQVSGIFCHGVDRTAEVRAAQSLSMRERALRNLADNTPDLLMRFDRQLRHVFVNSAVEKITGRKVEELLGKSNREMDMPAYLCNQWDAAIRHVFEHGSHASLDFEWTTPGKGLRYYASRLVPEVNDEGMVEFVLCVTHDVTRRRAFEQQLADQARRKDEFLATLAHELRNPLAPIRTGLQVLKLAPDLAVATQILPVMERQLGQMVRLIDDLLDVSRINSGKIVLRLERLSLQEVVASALEASRPLIDAAGHSLRVDLPADLVWLEADPTRLSQVLSNLLSNSAKYTRTGGQIHLAATLLGKEVHIAVADNGAGIPEDMLSSVFDMFTQIKRTLDQAEGGLGLGLSLVKTLVQLHGGTVRADSPGIDQGSKFTVTLPTATRPDGQPACEASSPTSTVRNGRRILVVDDNVDAAETMVMLLELSGHEARSAYGGQQALDVALSFRPELVFLDIGLPDMNGYEVARRLLADPATASTKLVALTGWGTEDDIRKSKVSGFHAHLTKPVDHEAVEALLVSLLPTRQA